jgi:hypothetical protein
VQFVAISSRTYGELELWALDALFGALKFDLLRMVLKLIDVQLS